MRRKSISEQCCFLEHVFSTFSVLIHLYCTGFPLIYFEREITFVMAFFIPLMTRPFTNEVYFLRKEFSLRGASGVDKDVNSVLETASGLVAKCA